MNYFAVWNPNPEEKNDILAKHRGLYNGYQTLNPAAMEKIQPLYTQDFAGDKKGLTVNNKGEVKYYTHMGINENVKENMCEQCGGKMNEGLCEQCGGVNENMCEQCGGTMKEEVCEQCGGMNEQMYGQDLDKTTDLNPKAGFDYIQGSSNDVDTFEGSHKKLYREQDGEENSFDTVANMIMQSQEFQDLIASVDPTTFEDEFEYADNMIYWAFSDFEGEDFYDDLIEYVKYNYADDFFDAYQVVVMGNKEDEDIEDIDYEEVDEQYDAVEPGYDFESDGPVDVYGTLKDYDKEHPHHDYDSMEDVEKYDPSDDLAKMFGLPTDPDAPSDTFQHDAGDVNRRGDAGLGMDTENDMDLGNATSGYNFYSDGSEGGESYSDYNEGEDMETGEELFPSYDSDGNFLGMVKASGDMEHDDYPLDESAQKEAKLIKEMIERMKKFI